MSTFKGLDKAICEKAWRITLKAVEEAYQNGVTNKYAGSLCVCYARTNDHEEFADSIVFDDDIVSGHPNAEFYAGYAFRKAKVSWQTGLPSRVVQQEAPFLYTPGMIKWGGSVVQNGLIVAFSGVQAVHDEAIANTMLGWIVSICRDEMTKPDGVMESESPFVGEGA